MEKKILATELEKSKANCDMLRRSLVAAHQFTGRRQSTGSYIMRDINSNALTITRKKNFTSGSGVGNNPTFDEQPADDCRLEITP